jgi:hypothetical protein
MDQSEVSKAYRQALKRASRPHFRLSSCAPRHYSLRFNYAACFLK